MTTADIETARRNRCDAGQMTYGHKRSAYIIREPDVGSLYISPCYYIGGFNYMVFLMSAENTMSPTTLNNR
jgi:hypothetical protein